jgi:hypothetical protein
MMSAPWLSIEEATARVEAARRAGQEVADRKRGNKHTECIPMSYNASRPLCPPDKAMTNPQNQHAAPQRDNALYNCILMQH